MIQASALAGGDVGTLADGKRSLDAWLTYDASAVPNAELRRVLGV